MEKFPSVSITDICKLSSLPLIFSTSFLKNIPEMFYYFSMSVIEYVLVKFCSYKIIITDNKNIYIDIKKKYCDISIMLYTNPWFSIILGLYFVADVGTQ